MAITSPYENQGNLGIGTLSSEHPAFQQYKRLKEAQAASMEQHKQYALGLQQKQQQVDMRAGDLDVAGRLLKIFDPNINKGARQFLMRELAQNVGVDPKNENFKAVQQMVGGLDPNSMQMLKQMFTQHMNGADPGQIKQLTNGILNGTVPMDTVMGELQALSRAQPPQQQAQTAGGPSAAPAAQSAAPPMPTQKPVEQAPTAQAPMAGPGVTPTPAQGAGEVMSFKEKRTFQPQAERVDPQLAGELGMDSKVEARNQDFLKSGYTIPLDPKAQREVASELSIRTPNTTAVVKDVAGITSAIGNTSASENFRSVSQRVIGMHSSKPGFANESGPGTQGWEDIETLAEQKATAMVKTGDPEAIANVKNTLMNLGYLQTLTGGMPGNKLTNGVLGQNINSINSLSDMYRVAGEAINTTLTEYDKYTRANTGQSGINVMLSKSPDKVATISNLAKSTEGLSPEMRQQVLDAAEKLKKGESLIPKVEPQSPTMEEERKTLGGMEVKKENLDIANTEQQMDLRSKADARDETRLQMQEGREERATKAQEAATDLEKQKFEFLKEKTAQDNALEMKKFEWQKQKFEEQKGEERRDKIGKAFQAFGSAIGNAWKGVSIDGGGGRSAGGGQDVGAFKINPAPQRQAPRPGNFQMPNELLYGR